MVFVDGYGRHGDRKALIPKSAHTPAASRAHTSPHKISNYVVSELGSIFELVNDLGWFGHLLSEPDALV